MPQSRGLYLRVGALVVAGLALAAGFVLFLTANRLDRDAVMYETYFRESVQGLEVGAPVRYRGVAIGRVAEIGLASAEYRRSQGEPFVSAFQLVVVRFTVDAARVGEVPSVRDAVRLGLRVRIAAQGITGVNYLELDFLPPDRYPPMEVPWRPLHTYIPAVPSTVAQVQTAAETLLQRLQDADLPGLLSNLSGLFADLRGEVREGGDLAVTLREAAGLMRALRAAAEGAALPEAVADLRGAATEARGVLGEAREVLASRELRQALASAAAAAAELRTAAQRLPGSLTAIEQGLRTARGATTDLQAELVPILRDLRAAMANLRDTTETLRRYPGQALFGSPPPAPNGGRR
jgi:ABC-type transporter Mla subunit MlaD